MKSRSAAVNSGLPAVLDGFDLTDQARFADGIPYPVFARLRREAPVLFHPPGHSADGEGFWVLSRYDDIVSAAGSAVFSSQGGGGRRGGGTHLDDLPMGQYAGALLPMMDDPRHDLIARLVRPPLTGRAVDRIVPDLRRYANLLIDRTLAEGDCDVAQSLTGPFAVETMALLLGVPESDRPQLTAWLEAVVGIVGRRSGVADDEARAVTLAIYQYSKELLGARRKAATEDLTSAIATGDIDSTSGECPLSDHEREINFLLLLQTGSEQPRNALAGGLLALAENPAQWEAVRADPSLIPTAVDEMLRWTPGNPYNRRTATRDVEFSGAQIRAGDKLTLWWASGNRDEQRFHRADQFDVRRHPNPHLSFGHGPHSCLGVQVAHTALRVFLGVLRERVSRMEPLGPPQWSPSNKHAVLVELPIRFSAADR